LVNVLLCDFTKLTDFPTIISVDMLLLPSKRLVSWEVFTCFYKNHTKTIAYIT